MEVVPHEKQSIDDGVGPLYHRIYSIAIRADEVAAKRALADLKADLNAFSPQAYARFEKVTGVRDELSAGDEFQIHLTGPWNGPVRVQSVDSDRFRLETLRSHLEAGFVVFRLIPKSAYEFVFEIESFAKSRDALVDFLYDKVPVAKLIQRSMWESFCVTFGAHMAKLAGGGAGGVSEVSVLTERRDESTGEWRTL